MENNAFYCFHCMTKLPAPTDVCPHCGKPPAERSNMAHQLPEGTLLQNRYLIGCVLGQGGFGITYVGVDTRLGRRVAIKEFFPQASVNRHVTNGLQVTENSAGDGAFGTGLLRFLDEARTLVMFDDDPNIVNVQDHFEENGTAYIVMEYLEGESLKSLLDRRGPLPFAQVFDMLRPVMRALAGLHAKGLIHRDISPSNLMLLNNGQVKLLDFGAAREMTPEGENSLSVVFKPGYAPEEQYMSRSAQGPWSDVYSLCASIYKLITNVTPENPYIRMENDTLRPPRELGADISPAAEAALLRGMAIKRKDRYQTMDELAAAFEAAKTGAVPAEEPEEEVTFVGSAAAAEEIKKADVGKAPVPAPQAPPRNETPPVPAAETTIASVAPPAKPEEPKPGRAKEKPAEKPKKTGGKPKKKKKALLAVIIAAALLLAGVVSIALLSKKVEEDSEYQHFIDETITTETISKIVARDSTTNLSFSSCTVGDDVVRKLSSLKNLEVIRFTDCTGFTTLSPLSACPALTCITLDGFHEQSIDLNAVFGSEMPQVTTLEARQYTTISGLSALSRFGSLQRLHLNKNTFAAGETLPALPMLTNFEIESAALNGLDLSPLGSCSELTSFSASDTALPDISFLNGLSALSYVAVNNCGLISLEPLQSAVNLYELHASDNAIADLSPLTGKEKLTRINLNHNEIKDISPLAGMTNVFLLELNENNISDVTPLQDMAKLMRLSLGGNALTDISPLLGCKAMEHLIVSYNELTTLSGCDEMIRLTELQAKHNQLKDISALSNSTQLKTVYLSENELTDISVLAKSADHLNTVLLDDNKLTDISPLKDAPELYALSVNRNRLTSLSHLTGCAGLYAFSANGNQLTDISGLRDCTTLYGADLGENQISDISPLNETGATVMVLMLQNNRITDISSLNPLKEYKLLSLYNNAIRDFKGIAAMTAAQARDVLYVTLTERASLADIAASNYKKNVHLIDVPLDQQVEIETEFKEAHGEKDTFMASKPIFQTKEEADQDMAEARAELNKALSVTVWEPTPTEGE